MTLKVQTATGYDFVEAADETGAGAEIARCRLSE